MFICSGTNLQVQLESLGPISQEPISGSNLRVQSETPSRMPPRPRPGHAQASSYHPSSLPLAVPQCAGPARASEYTSLSIRASVASWHHDGMISESALMTRITSHDTIM